MGWSTTNVPVQYGNTTIGTASVKVDIRNIDIRTDISAFGITLPPGRWLATVFVDQKPGKDGYPLTWTYDTGNGFNVSGGTINVPALTHWANLDLDVPTNRRDIVVEISVKWWNGTAWKPYATSSLAGVPKTFIGGTPTAYRSGQLHGANVHSFGDSDSCAKSAPLVDFASTIPGLTIIRTSPLAIMPYQSNGTIIASYWTELDNLMNKISNKGLKALLIAGVSMIPSWYSGNGVVNSYGNLTWSGSYKVAQEPGTTNGLISQSDLNAIIQAFANRYGSVIWGWEVANETDASSYSAYSDNFATQLVTLGRMLKTAIAASSQPGWKMVHGPLTSGNIPYFDAMLAAGLQETDYDLFGLHAYQVRFAPFTQKVYSPRIPMSDNYDQSIGGIEDFWEYYTSLGFSKHLAVTEFGVSSTAYPGFAQSEAEQADYLPYMLKQLARLPYVDLAMIHTMEDVGEADTWSNRFGLFRFERNGIPKPAVAPFKTALASLP